MPDTSEEQPKSNPDEDRAYHNIRLLTRDLLYIKELVQAVHDGDFGRIEDMLGNIACLFRGSGGCQYATEILHFLMNLKKVWTPEFAYVDLF
ncbi:hypothetical protein PLICRDRAFT_120211 [Plicaturopsis crispa FD-325 SS-3]|uniref:DUF6589 domain-containing protein n=1 Tax=Plicaturopsis crispa FD-325 SS-3 TaxID=944288 RepID=A0A0C9T105_PLICR|nr:hypothetical protein PLICRDRAFT_120211 [Plicaturopsis crispa FD-325 SS-3]